MLSANKTVISDGDFEATPHTRMQQVTDASGFILTPHLND